MSILIKGMKMPKSCSNCWALDDYGDYPRCRITEEQRGYTFPIREKRMDKCPLIEQTLDESYYLNIISKLNDAIVNAQEALSIVRRI